MALPALARGALVAPAGRKLLGCGCAAAVAAVGLPFLILAAAMGGLFSALPGGAGASQVDGFGLGGEAMVVGSGEPLPPGAFTVSQGFGCTTVTVEPPPPVPYRCPPDAAHPSSVRFHTGIDMAARSGTPVFAVAAGMVRVIASAGGFGLHIVLTPTSSGPTLAYLYGHLSGVTVVDREAVPAGQVLGYVGSSGNSTGPHLHFEVDAGGVPVNPCSVFPAGYLVPAGLAAGGCLAWSG